MKLFAEEQGKTVNVDQLKAELMSQEAYSLAHQGLVIPCHDIVIEHDGGALLVERRNQPVYGEPWPIGGRILRGMRIEDSLRLTVKRECGLEVDGLQELGVARTCFQSDPFGHGKGTDTVNFMFYGKGKGTLKLDGLHSNQMIVPLAVYSVIRPTLHPYVREITDKVMNIIDKDSIWG